VAVEEGPPAIVRTRPPEEEGPPAIVRAVHVAVTIGEHWGDWVEA
jgi:hypothetical protein